jgi:citrate/tricarballylate utilization protein
VAAVLAAGMVRFRRAAGGAGRELLDVRAWLAAGREALTLRWLDGGGGGCYYPDPERPSDVRRVLHGAVVAGLLLAFAATVVAAVLQDALGQLPPYPVVSAPVLLGTAGGMATIAGCTGLLALRAWRARALSLEAAFLVALDAAAITGMLTLGLRATPLLGAALVLHLGTLVALYVTAPYGKLVHAVYRFAALLRDVGERAAAGS